MALAEAKTEQKRDRKAVDGVIAALAAQFGNRLVTSQAVREQHGHTVTWTANQPPDAVVFPQTTEDVVDAVRLCAGHAAGHRLRRRHVPRRPSQCAARRRLDRYFAHEPRARVHAEDLDCVVEPGVTRKALNEHLRDTGLFFPIDPGADASIGGMAATRASGTNAVRYGTMKDNVLSLKVVHPPTAPWRRRRAGPRNPQPATI